MPVVQLSEIDKLIKHFDDASNVSSDSAYAEFSKYSLTHPVDLPEDPFSPEYAAVYMDLYKKISTRVQYTVDNEKVDFDIAERVLRPFPYYSKSLRLAAQHYSLIGGLLGYMGDLKEGSDILECGFGWGNTTLALAMLGHNVTALDINEKYCEVVRRRAELVQVNVNLIHGDYLWVETTDQTFDAIVFFESFHHCLDFERLLRSMHRVLRPGGMVIFGAEPINGEFPVPWGVRLDGESLTVARRFGWMELGFRSDFFVELMRRTGWWANNPSHNFWTATSRRDPVVIPMSDPRLKSMIGEVINGRMHVHSPAASTDRFYALFGPYMPIMKGSYRAKIQVDFVGTPPDSIYAEAAYNSGHVLAYKQLCDIRELKSGTIEFRFVILENAGDVEFRLEVPGGGWEMYIDDITLLALD